MFQKLLLYCSMVLFPSLMMAQSDTVMDFRWLSYTPHFQSGHVFTLCNGQILSHSLETSLAHQINQTNIGAPIAYGHSTYSVLIPFPDQTSTSPVHVRFSFSSPVADVQILIGGLNDDSLTAGPDEYLSNFQRNGQAMMPTSITATQGNFNIAGNEVSPTAADCGGWFRWALPTIYLLEFDYTRVSNNAYCILDSFKVACNATFTALAPSATDFEVTVSPTVAQDVLHLDCQSSRPAPLYVTVMDLSGKVVRPIQKMGSTHDLSVAELDQGLYFVRLTQGDREVVRKFVVARP